MSTEVKQAKTKVFGLYIFFKKGGDQIVRVISEDETTAIEVYAQITHGKSWKELNGEYTFNKIAQYTKQGNIIRKL